MNPPQTFHPCPKKQKKKNVPTYPTYVRETLPLELSLVVLELEVEAASRLKGVEVERPALLSSASTLLVLRVQRILAGVKLLPHFCQKQRQEHRDKFKTVNTTSLLNKMSVLEPALKDDLTEIYWN